MKTNIPEWLVPTKAELEEIERDQADLREKFAENIDRYVRGTPYEKRYESALREEAISRGNLVLVLHPLQRAHELRQLADSLLHQGRYSEALNYADGEQRAYILKIAEAVQKADDHLCECEDQKAVVGKHVVELSRHYIVDTVYSPKHRSFLPLRACNVCGEWNVTAEKTDAHQRTEQLRHTSKGKRTPDAELHTR